LATEADTFVVAEGTSIPNVNLASLLEEHHARGACVTVVVNSEARRNGNSAIQVPSGIYVFARRALEQVPARGFCDIKEKLIPQLYASGERIVAHETASATPRVLDAATYMAVNEWMVDALVHGGAEHDGYIRMPNGLVSRDAFVAQDATLVGPVLIGQGAQVLSGAVVVGPTSIGSDAIIECGALVSRCAVWRRSVISENATTDRCIVADDAVVEPGMQAFRDVVIADTRRETKPELPAQRPFAATRDSSLEVGAKLARLVFGTGWSRSPAAQ
jgi:NDP-sugar pyrophosphorylase family protein